jgi:uroporphyrin-III C-methyltransferase
MEPVVYLVGAGPGDPELLTLKAARLLGEAGAVLYDALVSPSILSYCRPEAELIYVGKRAERHAMPQDRINEMLARLSATHSVVVRLKGGDPFIFGRGGEELYYLKERNISCEVVPGITAATACSASHGIPLTHRNYTNRLVFLSGHTRDSELPDLSRLDPSEETIVIYMGVGNLSRIARQLSGKSNEHAEIPLVVVENASTSAETIHHATLGSVHILDGRIKAPALVLIGRVCEMDIINNMSRALATGRTG